MTKVTDEAFIKNWHYAVKNRLNMTEAARMNGLTEAGQRQRWQRLCRDGVEGLHPLVKYKASRATRLNELSAIIRRKLES
jgi:hypothetical protein